jgi:hypothetical protein
MRESPRRLLIRQLSAGSSPRAWLSEWTLLTFSIFLLGASSALLLAAYFVPPISKAEAARQQHQLEDDAQEFLDTRGYPIDIRNPYPDDPESRKHMETFWEERRFRFHGTLRNAGFALLGASGACGIAALFLRSRRTRTAGYARLVDRITEGSNNSS